MENKKLVVGVICDQELYESIVEKVKDSSSKSLGYKIIEEEDFRGYNFVSLDLEGCKVVLGQAKYGKVSSSIVTSRLISNYDADFLLCLTRFVRFSKPLSSNSLVVSRGVIQHDVDIRPWYSECVMQSVKQVIMPVSEYFVENALEILKHEVTKEVTDELNVSGDVYLTTTEAASPRNKVLEHIRSVLSYEVDVCDTISSAPIQLAFESKKECGVIGVSQDNSTVNLLETLKVCVSVISKHSHVASEKKE